MVLFYTPLILSLLLPLTLLLSYTLYICNKNICTYVLAMLLPGVLAVALWRDVPKVAWLSHCHVEFFKVILLSHWHVELSKDMKNTSYQFGTSQNSSSFFIAWRLYFIVGYHFVAWRFFKVMLLSHWRIKLSKDTPRIPKYFLPFWHLPF